jgi:hypothetical protein
MKIIILVLFSIVAANAQTIRLSLGTVDIAARDAQAVIWMVNNSALLKAADADADGTPPGAEVRTWLQRELTSQAKDDDGFLSRLIAEATKRYIEANDGELATADQEAVDAYKAARQAYIDRFGVEPK